MTDAKTDDTTAKDSKKKLYIAAGVIIAIVVIAGVVLALSLGTPAGKSATSSDVKSYTVIRIANETGSYVNLATIADAKGFFAEHGIKVEWIGPIAGGGPGQLAAMAGGSQDAGSAAISAIINAQVAGVKVKAVGSEYVTDSNSAEWYALNSSGIKSANDLVGKNIGVNTLKAAQEWTVRKYLEENNLSIKNVNLVVVDTNKAGNPYLAEQLLRKGDISLISASDILQNKLVTGGGVTPLFSEYDVWGNASGKPAYVVTNDLIQKNPEAVKGFVAALAEAADYTNTHPEESLQIVIAADYPGINATVAKNIHAKTYPTHGLISESQVESWIAFLEKEGAIKAGVVKLSDVYTNEFNPYYSGA